MFRAANHVISCHRTHGGGCGGSQVDSELHVASWHRTDSGCCRGSQVDNAGIARLIGDDHAQVVGAFGQWASHCQFFVARGNIGGGYSHILGCANLDVVVLKGQHVVRIDRRAVGGGGV